MRKDMVLNCYLIVDSRYNRPELRMILTILTRNNCALTSLTGTSSRNNHRLSIEHVELRYSTDIVTLSFISLINITCR